jgi:two-component system alkaline phosphatase synthesis response regulator PhoP
MSEKKIKILVMEDDPFLRSVYEVKLANEGFEVKIASDGKEGIEIYSKFKPDIILLDIIMPEIDGFAVLEELKVKKKVKTPIVVLSNLGQDEDVEKAKELGADDFLIKASTQINSVVDKIKLMLKK